ncbi:hypothetical protein PV08_11332 [Exophiala spinifera]|uniref:C2H2-type domain-containing protein n=1 Tax=Exophiala spinifera TaxID=91928 RepID=A0A0D2AV64_9EURO|nr:uncharacterized protein PV08_11332 [Exophiala spinifera]KIW10370.1 hypothetical protein PV08_11332 [Exophiala spinifera]
MMAFVQGQPHPLIKEAFTKFEALVGVNDARLFKSTILANVREAAQIIERDQSQRRCLRNMRRIEPLFDALQKLAGPMETLCSGTPYLCFIWAPIKLVLHIVDEYTNAFDQLLDAYREIAQNLPRCDRLGTAFCDQDGFQAVLAEIYSDILEFHTYSYQYLRRGGWKSLFDASWKSFSRRFNSILQRLARGRDLIDKEAQSFAILEAKEFRQQVLEKIERFEHDRHDWQLRDTLSWLDLKGQDREQDDLFECRSSARKPGTCEWILQNPKVRCWLDPEDCRSQLWLRGKPGSGKTTLVTFLYDNAPIPPNSFILYCLCSYGFARSEANVCGLVFRSLLAQLVRKQRSLLSHVYYNFVNTGVVLSASKARDLLKSLLQASGPAFLMIDGLDECEGIHQRQLLSDMRQLLVSTKPISENEVPIKILICSRETKDVGGSLKKVPQLFLTEEKDKVSKDIAEFAKDGLSPLKERFDATVVAELEQDVVEKADGMFLWVQLVLQMLLEQHSVRDLRNAVEEMPTDLPGVYASILNRIQKACNEEQKNRLKHIFGWLAFSYRPLKVHELCDLVVFQKKHVLLDDNTKLRASVLEMCKPLLEEHGDHSVTLVHFSTREYFLHEYSGPYLPRQQIHLSITQACIRYLMTCQPFTSESLTGQTRTEIVKGFHDIYPYVNQFWANHLVECFRDVPTIVSDEDSRAKKEVYSLLIALLQSFQVDGQDQSNEAGDNPTTTLTHTRILALEDLPSPILQVLDLKKGKNAKGEALSLNRVLTKRPPRQAILEDPVSLNAAFSCFQNSFEALLTDQPSDLANELGVSLTEIIEFKTRHSYAAYLCRKRGCVRASVGFQSPEERSKHETCHDEKFRCPEPACDFSVRGFPSRSGLQRHYKTYHRNPDDIVLPPFPSSRHVDNDEADPSWQIPKAQMDSPRIRTPSPINGFTSKSGHNPNMDQAPVGSLRFDFSTLENNDVIDNFDFDRFLNSTSDDIFNFDGVDLSRLMERNEG